jgi:hypothetical protein
MNEMALEKVVGNWGKSHRSTWVTITHLLHGIHS